MAIYKNNKKVIGVYKGTTPVLNIYRGGKKVFSKSTDNKNYFSELDNIKYDGWEITAISEGSDNFVYKNNTLSSAYKVSMSDIPNVSVEQSRDDDYGVIYEYSFKNENLDTPKIGFYDNKNIVIIKQTQRITSSPASDMFGNLSSVEGTINIAGDNSSLNANEMFKGCTKLEKVTIKDFSNIEKCDSAFMNCSALKEVIIAVPEVSTSMLFMFYGCNNLQKIKCYKSLQTKLIESTSNMNFPSGSPFYNANYEGWEIVDK